MTVHVIGELKLEAELPLISLGPIYLRLQAELDALLAFKVTPPALQVDVDLAVKLLADLRASLNIGLVPPSIDVQLAIVLNLIAELKLTLSSLKQLKDALQASAHMYVYDGTVSSFGAEMSAEISSGLPGGSGSDLAYAVVFIATAPAAISALQSLFKTP